MLRVTMAALRAHRLRVPLMALGVALGVSMFGGSLIYADSARTAFFEDLSRAAIGVDLVAEPVGQPGLAGAPAVAALTQVPGVAHADGRVISRLGLLNKRGRVLTNGQDVGLAVSVPSWPGFSAYRLVDGRLPRQPAETALDRPTAQREKVGVGGQVTVVDRAGRKHRLRVVGLIDFGVTKTFADASVLALTSPDLHDLAGVTPDGTSGDYAQIVVSAASGADLVTLRQQVAATLGAGYTVSTGEELRQMLSVEAAKYIDGFQNTLRVTALVSLVVASLVIHNTFQIVMAGRTREHALLRCLGAGRRHIRQLVIYESVGIGLVASVVSVGLSLLAARLLLVAQEIFGSGLPDYRLIVTPLSVLAPIGLGVAVCVIAAMLPAIGAGRVSPLDALRASTDAGSPARRSTVRYLLTVSAAAVLAGAGLAALRTARGEGFDGLPAMAAAAVLVLTAVVLLLPLVLTTLTAPLRFALGRLFGPTGRIAMSNTHRHPMRFAATTTAFIIGVAPLTMFSLLLATAKVQGVRELAENFPVDFVVSHPYQPSIRSTFDPALIGKIRAVPEFGVVALSRVGQTDVNGCCYRVGTVEPEVLGTQVALEVRTGELGGLRPGTAAVTASYAADHGLTIGDPISLGPPGQAWPATVVATFDGSPVPADVIVNWSDFAAHLTGDDHLLILRANGVSAATAADALDASLVGDPGAILTSTAQRRESLVSSFNRRQNQMNVLLAVTMVIAVLGIATTLFLAVLERAQESAVLRAMGLARRQLFGMLLLEAALTAFVGALVGIAFGIGFGWITAQELIRNYGHGSPAIPVRLIMLYLAVAVIAAVVASVLPARQASRASAAAALN